MALRSFRDMKRKSGSGSLILPRTCMTVCAVAFWKFVLAIFMGAVVLKCWLFGVGCEWMLVKLLLLAEVHKQELWEVAEHL